MKYENKTVINADGYIVAMRVLLINSEVQNFKMQDGYKLLGEYSGEFVKPHWNGRTWEEGAIEEEIQAYKEENKTVKEPTEQEKINSQLLQANAQQQLVNASLLKQIAELQKGGN